MIDTNRLKKVKQRGSHTDAQCPACAEAGTDKQGNHLRIFPSGAFCCVVNPNDRAHQKRIHELAGDTAASSNRGGAEIYQKAVNEMGLEWVTAGRKREKPQPLKNIWKR